MTSPALPIALKLERLHCLVVGGGAIALEKIEKLLNFNANITVVTISALPKILELAKHNKLNLELRAYAESDLDKNYKLVISAVNNKNTLEAIYTQAKQRNLLFNAVDKPEYCDFYFTSVITQGDIAIGVSSNGVSPTATQYLRDQIAKLLDNNFSELMNNMKQFRANTIRDDFSFDKKKHLIQDYFSKQIIHYFQKKYQFKPGSVCFVSAGPGDSSHYTINSIQALQAANIVLYDSLVDKKSLLLYCHEHTEKIFVGKRAGSHSTEQKNINQLLVEHTKKQKFVVRLKGGDCSLFSRCGEEIEALIKSNIDYKIIPGITAASTAAAKLKLPLTQRDHANKVTFLTAQLAKNQLSSFNFLSSHLTDTTFVIYMGLTQLNYIINKFLQHGFAKNTPIALLSSLSLDNEKVIISTLDNIVSEISHKPATSPTIIIIGNILNQENNTDPVSHTELSLEHAPTN